MRPTLNPKTFQVEMLVEEEDVPSLLQIREMMAHPGWQELKKIYDTSREEIIDWGKKCARVKAKNELCKNALAMADGFDQGVLIPHKLMEMLKIHLAKEKEEEYPNAGNDE